MKIKKSLALAAGLYAFVGLALGLAILVASTSTSAALSEDLVGWWKLDEEEGIVASDSSGKGNDGELFNDPDWVGGQIGNALDFNGSTQYVNVGDDSSLKFTDKFTVEAWINAEAFQTSYYDLIVFRGYNKWAFGIYRGDRLMFGETSWNSLWSRHIYSDTVPLTAGKWYHIAVVYDTDARTADFYLDGSPVGAGKKSTDLYGITNSGDVTINYPHSVSFNGLIDDVKIWKVALSAEDLEDNDGVRMEDDLCLGTAPDEFEDLGVNRWMWDGEWLKGDLPNDKDKGPSFDPEMSYTHGCSCTQILDSMSDTTGLDFGGHYKYGCSKSILEDWYNGEYFLETVNVPSDQTIVSATSTIESDETYRLHASGTYIYATWAGNPVADAKCSWRGTADPLGYSNQWLSGDDLPSPYTNYLEVRVNGSVVGWGVPSGTCNPSNEYSMEYTGADHLDFNIYDGGAIGDNSGSIPVDIFVRLW